MARTALYVRCSGDEQAEKRTPESQLQFLRQYCAAGGLEIAEEYVDQAVSGIVPFEKREAGGKLLRDAARRHFALVLTFDLTRLARSVPIVFDTIAELEKHGVGYRSASEGFSSTDQTGKLMLGFMSVIASWERGAIRSRCITGKRRVVSEGKWPGSNYLPFGYCLDEQGHLQRDDEPIPGFYLSPAAVVQMIFARIVEQHSSLYAVAQWLDDMRVPTPSQIKDSPTAGDRWSICTIRNIIRKTTYKGQFIFSRRGEQPLTVDVPALVSEEVWQAAQEQLHLNLKRSPRNSKHPHLLSGGLCHCGACGLAYVYVTHQGRYRYLYCSGRHKPAGKPKCASPRLRADDIENMIWADIVRFVQSPTEALETLAADLNAKRDDASGIQEQADKLTSLIKGLQGHRDRIHRLFIMGKVDEAQVEEMLLGVEAEEAALVNARQEKLDILAAAADLEAQLETAQSLLQQMGGCLQAASPEERQAVVRRAVKSVTVYEDRLRVHYVFSPIACSPTDHTMERANSKWIGLRVVYPLN